MLPYIIIFSTVSIDGRLATKTGYSQLSCPFDKQR
ncbi:MAG: dihydrofolate reductase family protein, partial [Candidatus Aramenus sp.]|nr:dihydrofolate reductase family protein [Candidatus Aramenus sp.]